MRTLAAIFIGSVALASFGCGSSGGTGGEGGGSTTSSSSSSSGAESSSSSSSSSSGAGGAGGGMPNPAKCGGIGGVQCGAGFVCDWDTPNVCGASDVGGTCKQTPDACDKNLQPVCGCDGVTYGNDCERFVAGVALDHDGECANKAPDCGGIAGLICPANTMCDDEPGVCKGADILGKCKIPPHICGDIEKPVCGCDGKTYGNDCKRRMAGAQLDHDGAC